MRAAKQQALNGKQSSTGTLQTAVELTTTLEEDDAAAFASMLDTEPDKAVNLMMEQSALSETEARVVLCNYSYAAFAKEYLPHYFSIALSERFHSEYFRLLADVEHHFTDKPTVVSAPRETGKSTMSNLLLPLHSIHYPSVTVAPNKAVIDMSKHYIVFMSSTQKNAMNPLYDICTEMEWNDALQRDFGNMYLDPNGFRPSDRPWSKTAAVTSNGVKLEACGRFAKIRGMRYMQHRPDLLLPDDLEDDKSVQSSIRRQDDVKWFNEAVIPCIMQSNGNILVTGTLLHLNCMLAKLLEFGKQNGWNTKVFPIYEDTPEGRVYLWEERYGEEWVKLKQMQMPASAFTQEYLQKPGGKNSDIKLEDFTFYDREFDDVLQAVEQGRFITCIGVDPAAKTGERNDYTAIVPVAFDPATGIKYVLPAYIDRATWNTKIQAVIGEHLRWNAVLTGIESVQFQIALKDAIDIETRRQGVTIRTEAVNQSMDKKLRISRIFSSIATGTIRFLRHRSHSIIIDQLVNLHSVDYDDGADALEIAIRLHDDRAKKNRVSGSVAMAEF